MATIEPSVRSSGEEYESFVEAQGVPVHKGYYVEDANESEVDDWDLTGAKGAIINLVGQEGMNDLHIHEIPSTESMTPQCHLYEEISYVLSGQGLTEIGPEGEETTVEWGENALFAIPRNTRYRHVNLSDDEPARILSTTDLPLILTLHKDEEVVFNPGHTFDEPADPDYYTKGEMFGEGDNLLWQANFVPDSDIINRIEDGSRRGAGNSIGIHHPHLSMWSHVSRIPVGQYRNIHRHHPGANILVLQGEGYSLMWPSGDPDAEKMRIDWKPGTVFTPPALWWHEHFNLHEDQSRYAAFHASDVVFAGDNSVFDFKADYNIIDYPDEDPEIREMFEAELEKRSRVSQMPEGLYEKGSKEVFGAE